MLMTVSVAPVPGLIGSFALPAVAAAAAALGVAVPVLIHLLSRQRYQVVSWAAMRFLLAAQNRRRRWVDRWLLLLTRVMLGVLLLAAMCAVTPWAEYFWQQIRPGPLESSSTAPRTHTILILDASLSMSARAGSGTLFDTAVSLAEKAVRSANLGDGFSLIIVRNTAEIVIPGPSNEFAKVLAELRDLSVTDGPGDFIDGVNLAADILARSPRAYPRRQVLYFTDLQRYSWQGLLPDTDSTIPDIWNRILPRADFAVIDVGQRERDNLAVTSLSLSDPIPFINSPASLTATVQNFGRADRANLRVELAVYRSPGGTAGTAGEPSFFPVEQRLVELLPAGQSLSLSFSLDGPARFREPGIHLLRVRLIDSDDLPADNTRILAVRVREGLPVLLVNGQPSADPFRRATEYLQEALDPGGMKYAGNPVRPRTVSLSEFADPALGDLSAVDCVILADVPVLSPAQIARLEAHLKRGGSVIVGLGPNVAENLDFYNRLLYAEGTGILPGRLLGVRRPAAADDPGYRLVAEDQAYREPPLSVFQDDNARAGLTGVPFQTYLRIDAPLEGPARRLLSFVPSIASNQPTTEKPEPALIAWKRHRGQVIVFTSSFNTAWNDWPVLPSFLPFVHELLRFAVAQPDRHTVTAGEPLEEFFPATTIGLTATIVNPQGRSWDVPVMLGDEVGLVRFLETQRSGIYRISVPGQNEMLFSVNPPESSTISGSESDLRRLDPSRFATVGPIQVVTDPGEVRIGGGEETVVVSMPRPQGPTVARWLLLLALLMAIGELFLAWRLGPSRVAGVRAKSPRSCHGWLSQGIGWLAAGIPCLLGIAILLTLLHARQTGNLLGFVPASWRARLESLAGIPEAAPGEGTRWRLESSAIFTDSPNWDRLGLGIMTLVVGGLAILAYFRERQGSGGWSRLTVPLILRLTFVLIVICVLLPQFRLAFDREGWPDLAILIDTSGSMATIDEVHDPEIAAKFAELATAMNLRQADRLQLATALITRSNPDWLTRILQERNLKIHLYRLDEQAKFLASLADLNDREAARATLATLVADGEASRLGDGVQAVLKSFRGSSLTAMIVLTDGVTTAGDDLPTAGQAAARENVPLYLVGIGDSRDPLDLLLSDLKADDVVLKGDTLAFEARLTVKGPQPPTTVPVILWERQGDQWIERARETVKPGPSGNPVPVRLHVIPKEVGETTFVIEVPVQPGEIEPGNNRLERTVLVTDTRRIRVLYIEGYPRYEFRFVKALLERETDAVRGNKSIDLNTLLLDASPGYAEQDRSALRGFPTRAELFEYDVIILGDIEPEQLPKAAAIFQDIAEFVKTRGGGLLFLAGSKSNPQQLFATALGELLPILPSNGPAVPANFLAGVSASGFRPRLTPLGQSHPLFRFAADDAENARIWASLRPLLWSATGYRKKPLAEVLAVHPDRRAEDDPSAQLPIILQQFVGAGRVIFLGFDDTWRWRFREGEERFNQFWFQAIRVLSRSRVSRLELRTDKQTAYRQGEPIRLTVRFPDDAPAPNPETPVKVQVTRGPLTLANGSVVGSSAESSVVQLAKIEGSRATYQALLTRTPIGDYRFTLVTPELETGKPQAEAKVLPAPGERDRLEMNRADLARAAGESRGRFYTLADADRLIDELPAVERIPLHQPVPPIPVWNHVALYALLLSLLAAEWLLRRQECLL